MIAGAESERQIESGKGRRKRGRNESKESETERVLLSGSETFFLEYAKLGTWPGLAKQVKRQDKWRLGKSCKSFRQLPLLT